MPGERQPRTEQTELRIEHIADLMRRFRFVRGKTSRALAADWGLALKTVQEYTAAASKVVRAELEDPDRVRADVCLTLATIMRGARKASRRHRAQVTDPETGETRSRVVPPDWQAAKVAIDAAKTWAAVTGNAAASKVDVTHKGDFASAKEALVYLRGLIPELEEQAANETEPGKEVA